MLVWVLDDNELQGDLASAASPFVPSYKNGANRRARGGGYWATYGYSTTFRSSYRYWAYGATIKPYYVGFRLAWIDNRQGK
jgi:hypothetical protein